MKYTASLLVEGIVQGVGFRPAVYRMAKNNNLTGYVQNAGNIVKITVQGTRDDITRFMEDLDTKKPVRSQINNITADIRENNDKTHNYSGFIIKKSSNRISGSAVIPPDMSICDKCLDEIRDSEDRHHHYPFTACTDCGPRFSLIRDVPYDRNNTTMDRFPLCDGCREEYDNPGNRRYHAEATCCDKCGPEVFLYRDKIINTDNPIRMTAGLIDEGKILAVKGIGGTHLVCKTTDDTVQILRERLGRETQPFACMMPDIRTAQRYVNITGQEQETLQDVSKPIVILDKKDDYNLSEYISPGVHNQGIMLPYTGLHHLLFKYSREPAYIMTSANLPGNPMLTRNREITENLKNIADYYLLHNRKIINRCDDSVIRYRNNKPGFIRRSRGYTPKPYDFSKIDTQHNLLATGPELDVTFSILKKGKCYPSQHIGNTSKPKTMEFMKDAIRNMMKLTKTGRPDYIIRDLHPDFNTTKLAENISRKYNIPVIPVQHHHAHAATLLAEHELNQAVVITADGVGYGEDGDIWGGEVMYLNNKGKYINYGGARKSPMPGGDISTKYPIRMATGILSEIMDHEELGELMKKNYADLFKYKEKEVDITLKQIRNNFNTSHTSSIGRILDSISVLLKISKNRGYEGECSMKLEACARKATEKKSLIEPEIYRKNNRLLINTPEILENVVKLADKNVKTSQIAYSAQDAIARALTEIAIKTAEKTGAGIIGATGGVFYNQHISQRVKQITIDNGYKFVQNENTCPGDGSVSVGQCAVAAWKLNN